MLNFNSKLISICVLILVFILTSNSNAIAQKYGQNNKNDIVTEEPLFGQSVINESSQAPVFQNSTNTQLFKSKGRSRKVTFCNAGEPGCEIDEPLDSQILVLIGFVFLFAVYSLNKKLLLV